MTIVEMSDKGMKDLEVDTVHSVDVGNRDMYLVVECCRPIPFIGVMDSAKSDWLFLL